MQKLADQRRLEGQEVAKASEGARELLANWCEDGWVRQAR